nr:ABC transporter permease subunit [Candidatus Sigynarchaeota archaeon]
MLRWKLLIKISKNDWKEISGNKQIFIPMVIVPIFFTLFLPIMLIVLPIVASSEADFIAEMQSIYPSITTMGQAVMVMLELYVNGMIRSFFVMIPIMITLSVASDSWAGEKERKTAESLLLLPLTDTELFVAKVLSSFIPGVLVSYVCAAGMMAIIDITVLPYIGYLYLPNAGWFYQLFVFVPILSFFSIFINVWVSARARDTKSAQQLGGSVIVVFIGFLIGGFLGVVDLLMYIMTIGIGITDLLMIYFAPKIFSREKLIARF